MADERRWLFLIDLSICGDCDADKNFFLTSVYHAVSRLLVNVCAREDCGSAVQENGSATVVQWTYRFYDSRGGVGRTPHELAKTFAKYATSQNWSRNRDFAPVGLESLHSFQDTLKKALEVLLADPLKREYELSAHRMLVQSLTEVLHDFKDDESETAYGSTSRMLPKSAGHKVVIIAPLPTSRKDFVSFMFDFESKLDISTRLSTSPGSVKGKEGDANRHRSIPEAKANASNSLCSNFGNKLSVKNVDLLWVDSAGIFRIVQGALPPADFEGLDAMSHALLALSEMKERERAKILGDLHNQIGASILPTTSEMSLLTANGLVREVCANAGTHQLCSCSGGCFWCKGHRARFVVPLSLLLIAPQVTTMSSILNSNRSSLLAVATASNTGDVATGIEETQGAVSAPLWGGLVAFSISQEEHNLLPPRGCDQTWLTLCGMEIFPFRMPQHQQETAFPKGDLTTNATRAVIRNVVCTSKVSPKEMTSELFLCLPRLQTGKGSIETSAMCGECSLCDTSAASFSTLMTWLSRQHKCAILDVELQNKKTTSLLLCPLNALCAIGRVLERVYPVASGSQPKTADSSWSLERSNPYSSHFASCWLENWGPSPSLRESRSISLVQRVMEQCAPNDQKQSGAQNENLESLRKALDQEYDEISEACMPPVDMPNELTTNLSKPCRDDMKNKKIAGPKIEDWETAMKMAYDFTVNGYHSSRGLESQLHRMWADAPDFESSSDFEPSSFACRFY
jgi:hypothetical protein